MEIHLFLYQAGYETRMDSTSFCMRLHFDDEWTAVHFMNARIFGIRPGVVMVSFSTLLQESQIRTGGEPARKWHVLHCHASCNRRREIPHRHVARVPNRRQGSQTERRQDEIASACPMQCQRRAQVRLQLSLPSRRPQAATGSDGPGESGGLQ
jgi:hypothetical protein